MQKVEVEDEILRLVTGSRLYGTNVGTSDEDFVSIFVESPASVFIQDGEKTRSLRSRGNEERSQAGDEEGVAYSVRHFVRLTANGNPSLLCLLWADRSYGHVLLDSDLGDLIFRNKDMFVSQQPIGKFLGYIKNQKMRMLGEKNGHKPKRPELEALYGFDTKYAGHAVRLGYQGLQFALDGKISCPMPEESRRVCLDIREGKYTFEECIELIENLEHDIKAAEAECILPEHPDWAGLARLSEEIHTTYWERTNGR